MGHLTVHFIVERRKRGKRPVQIVLPLDGDVIPITEIEESMYVKDVKGDPSSVEIFSDATADEYDEYQRQQKPSHAIVESLKKVLNAVKK